MKPATRPKIVGNWKMNGLVAAIAEAQAYAGATRGLDGVDRAICPPATLAHAIAAALAGSGVAVGGQDCHPRDSGAHTGDISAAMLADAGASLVIVGHSERRADHGESSDLVAAKAMAASKAGLHAIICVGETRAEREAGQAEAVVLAQLAASVPEGIAAEAFSIAYEPVWAIGTGLVAGLEDIAAMHDAIRAALVARFGDAGAAIAILYGGSVKPDNAGPILALANVGGALVGGASLSAADFAAITAAGVRQ